MSCAAPVAPRARRVVITSTENPWSAAPGGPRNDPMGGAMPEDALSERGDELARSGRLEGVGVPELLVQLSRESFSGALVLTRGAVEKVLFWRDGAITFAASSDAEDRLGGLLLRRGQVSVEALAAARRHVEPGRRLGQVLVAAGWLDADAVARAVADQIREIVLSLFPWREGRWRLTRAQLTSEPVELEDSVPEVVLAGVRRIRDWQRIRHAVGGPRAAYQVREAQSGWPPLGLVERSVLRALDSPQRVERICQEVYAPAYEVYRCLWALSMLGLIERSPGDALEARAEDEGEGRIGSDGVAELLLELGDRAFTGVLRLFGPREEGALHLREGRVVFATTREPEMSLLVHLLRRGVISDTDHEAALRRLLTGKRIGALLAERGVLASGEVERFVREQVAEVACRLARFQDGEYTLEQELPSDEPVTLDWSVEDLIVAALESTESFRPVWNALGGLEAVFRLRPEYLERLDRMRLRTLAWEIVSALREDRTLREILAGRAEPDYDVCRMVHALERVRVLERAPAPIEDSDAPFLEEQRPGAVVSGPKPEPEPAAASAPDGDADGAAGSARPGLAAELAPELFGLPPEEPPRQEDGGDEAPAVEAESPAGQHAPVAIPVDVDPPGEVELDVPATPQAEPQAVADQEAEPEPQASPEDERQAVSQAGSPDGVEAGPEERGEPGGPSLEDVDAELAAASPPEPERQTEVPLPPDVLAAVERFNRRHRVMFDELRREIGAGVRNYVQTCQRRLGELSVLFEGLQPDASGAFDPQGLGEALIAYRAGRHGVPDDDSLLETLIEKEILIVRDLLPAHRLEEIQRRLTEAS